VATPNRLTTGNGLPTRPLAGGGGLLELQEDGGEEHDSKEGVEAVARSTTVPTSPVARHDDDGEN
jgi:hypothetical protein